MQISARGEYAVRACLELASAYPATLSAQALADAQELPRKFLEAILADLRRAGVIISVRGAEGGYGLAHPPAEIPQIVEWFDKFGDKLPGVLWAELDALKARLGME